MGKKFTLRHKCSEKEDKIFGHADSLADAINKCVAKVRELGYNSEADIARSGLEARGYYCMGYSSNEVYIDGF